jgi:hypothetical protein
MTPRSSIGSIAQETGAEVSLTRRLLHDPRRLAVAIVGYTLLIMLWFVSISPSAGIDHTELGAQPRLTDWSTAIVVVGLVWTALLLVAAISAFRAPRHLAVPCMAATALSALALKLFIPTWFAGTGYIGISTSEFTDLFLIVGGALPGGEGTRLHIAACVALAALTVGVALRR